MTNKLKSSISILAILAIVGCGGGSSSSSDTNTSTTGDKNTSTTGDTNTSKINKPPIANAGSDQTKEEGEDVTLDGSASSDDGTIVKYEWFEGITPLGTGETYTTNTLSATTHTITLKVTDDDGATGSDEVNVTINPSYTPPPPPPNPTVSNIDANDLSKVVVTFSKALKSDTIKKEFFTLKQGTNTIAFDLNSSQNPKIALEFNTTLNFNTDYNLTLESNLTDNAENALVKVSKIFTTRNSSLLKTGQTTCYQGNTNTEIPCSNDGAKGQDGYYVLKDLGIDRSYSREDINSTAGIVTDNVTGLKWQDEEYTSAEATAIITNNESGKALKWATATNTYCQGINLNGTGWRLPNIEELESIVDYGKYGSGSKGAIDSNFSYVRGINNYWSSTSPGVHVWHVSFNLGKGYLSEKSKTHYVRCTKGNAINSSSNVCISNSNGTVSCTKSKLMWQDNSDVGSKEMNWEEALSYCEELKLAGYSDWRLPNIKELKSITDRKNKLDPSLKDGFKQKSKKYFWSSTSRIDNASYVWGTIFKIGHDYLNSKTDTQLVRCVR